jgi:Protein of unknown function (DUF3168)
LAQSIEEALLAFLKGDAVLVNLIPDPDVTLRLYPEIAPQSTTFPYATYEKTDEIDQQNLGGSDDMPQATIQLSIWSQGRQGLSMAKQVASTIRNSRGGRPAPALRLKEFGPGLMGQVYVREVRLEDEIATSEPPSDGSEFPVRRIDQTYVIVYDEQE